MQQGPYFGNADFLSAPEGNDFSSIQGMTRLWIIVTRSHAIFIFAGAYNIQNSNSTPESFNGSNDISVIPPVLPVTIPQNLSPQQQLQPPSILSSQILGSTPLSQIGCPPLPLDQYSSKRRTTPSTLFTKIKFHFQTKPKTDQLSPCGSSDEMDSELDSNNDDLSSNFSNNSGSKRQKRGILPKQATSVMRAWLFQHLVVSVQIMRDVHLDPSKSLAFLHFRSLASLSH